jgi:hypothetical protein
MVDGRAEAVSVPSQHKTTPARHTRRALSYAKPHLLRSAVRLAAYLLIAYLVLKLIGLVVPLVGGGIAYAVLRRHLRQAPSGVGDSSG